VKADGLAAGKGVVVAATHEEAEVAIAEFMEAGRLGDAGRELVLEERLIGEEASLFALCDGEHAVAFGSAQDHKAVGEGDTGPNTGGMGAYGPPPALTPALEEASMAVIVRPALAEMARRGSPFRGILFAGLMINQRQAKLLEFNVRFGDPECQALMARIDSDLVELMLGACRGDLAGRAISWKADPAIAVVMATRGYPGAYPKGSAIAGLEDAGRVEGVTVLHAATARDAAGNITAQGGRVLDIVATGPTLAEARARAYQAIDRIRWPEGFCRRDIAVRGLAIPSGTQT